MVQLRNSPRKAPPRSPRQAGTRQGAIDRSLDAEMFKAMADPTRLRLLACLAKCGRACTVTELAECCSVDLSVVSRHLRALSQAALIEAEKKGRVVLYRVCYADVSRRLRAIADAFDECSTCCSAEGACCG